MSERTTCPVCHRATERTVSDDGGRVAYVHESTPDGSIVSACETK